MKKIILLVVSLCVLFALTACGQPEITGYHIDENGKLIATYEDNTTVDLGTLTDTIANGANTISVNSDGFYVINGVVSKIEANLPESYEVDTNGNLIVTYTDTTTKNLGKFGNDAINTIDTIAISDDGFYVLNGIKTSIVAVNVFDVNFVTGYDATVKTQIVKDGDKVIRPQLEREGYTLKGWYCNGEEWRFNSDVVKNDMTLKAEWTANTYTVSFINEKGTNPESITVTYDSAYELPTVESFTGYTFNGWYYNNTKVDSTKWNIANDVTLIAKWSANKNTITLNANGGSVSKTSVIVTYGENYTLPVPTNTYGAFTGWLYNDEPITDSLGNSLEPWTFTSDITALVDWSIKVYNAEDLMKMSTYLNGEFILMNDIDLNGVNWTPIGTPSKPFTGHLNGNNKEIRNLTLYSHTGFVGLFGYTNEATIDYLTLSNVSFDIPTKASDIYCGSLVGWANNTIINMVNVSGAVTTANHSSSYTGFIGGVVGWAMTCELTFITNDACVTGAYNVGGLCGSTYDTTIACCINNGNITSTQGIAGGVIGFVDCELSESAEFIRLKNTGSISAVKEAGGIVGSYPVASDYSAASTAVFIYCANTGAISGGTDTNIGVGGLIGNAFTVMAQDCYNQGNITSGYGCGGLVGYCYTESSFTSCYSSGNISSSFYSGGIAGYAGLSCSMKECSVFGTLSSSGIACTSAGSAIAYAVNIANFYYNCSCPSEYKKGTSTTERYSANFYKNNLFFTDEIWDFSDSNYPTLFWEAQFDTLEL